MSSDNGKGGSVNANEQTIFQLIRIFDWPGKQTRQ